MQKLRKYIASDDQAGDGCIYIWGLLWMGSLTALMIGWLEHISVLLWVGVGLYCVYMILPLWMLFGFFLFVSRVPTHESALITLVLVSGIPWLLLFVQVILSGFLVVAISIIRMLANPRTPKAVFTVLGFLILLTGLIIDAIAAF